MTYSDRQIYLGDEADTRMSTIVKSLDSPFYINTKEYLLPDADTLKSVARSSQISEQKGIYLADALKLALDGFLEELRNYEQKWQARRK